MKYDYFKLNDFENYLIVRYKEEISEKRHIYSKLSLTFALFSILLISINTFLKRLPDPDNIYGIIFLALLFINFVLISIIFYFLIKIFIPRKIAFLANIKDLSEIKNKLESYYKSKNVKKKQEEINNEIMDDFRNNYITCIDHNFQINRKRDGYFTYLMYSLIITFIINIISIVFYYSIPNKYFNDERKKYKCQKVIKNQIQMTQQITNKKQVQPINLHWKSNTSKKVQKK